jgi:hypothetical protein
MTKERLGVNRQGKPGLLLSLNKSQRGFVNLYQKGNLLVFANNWHF